jgi:hypothetical protein
MPVARESGVVRHPAVEPEVTKPAIGQIEMDLLAQPPFGPDAHAVANNQHPHHQFGINRGPADAAVERLQLRAYLLEIEKPVDASEQVIIGDVVIEAEIVNSCAGAVCIPIIVPLLRKSIRGWNHASQRRSTAE